MVNRNVVNLEENKVNKGVLKEIRLLDPDKITPLEALKLVSKWKQKLSDDSSAKKTQSGKGADNTLSLFD